jgi:hypothetical protein
MANEGMFHEEPGTLHGPKHDEWGHIVTSIFPDKSVGATMEIIGPDNDIVGCRLLYVKNGDPATGYDRVWGYATIDAACEALKQWGRDYPKPPKGFIRDYRKKPIKAEA